MKRALCLVALAAAAACASSSREARSSGAAPGASTAGTASSGTAVVAPSDLGPDQVKLVQRRLADRGFAVDPTGTYDEGTRTALMDLQRARGLAPTAMLDQPTLDALGLDASELGARGGAATTGTGATQGGTGGATQGGTGAVQTPGVQPYNPPATAPSSGQPGSTGSGSSGGDDDTDR